MIKKILPISIFVLFFIIILLLGIQNMIKRQTTSQGTGGVIPTLAPGKQGKYSVPTGIVRQSTSASATGGTQLSAQEVQGRLPIIAPNFTLSYSPRMERYVVTLADDTATQSYAAWLVQNPSFATELQEQNVILSKQPLKELNDALDTAEKNKLSPEMQAKKDVQTINTIVDALMNIPQTLQNITPIPIILPSPTPTPSPVPTASPVIPVQSPQPQSTSGYVYYSQNVAPYGPLALPNGCTFDYSGCGPTTAAMILSSYVSSSYTPPQVASDMNKAGAVVGCYGSNMYDIYEYMARTPGVKLSSIMTLGSGRAATVVNDFKNYIDKGWTILALVNNNNIGHYIWVTNVTADGSIWAYDPAYGTGRPAPLNENLYAPYPYYILAFAVKKN